MEFAVLGRLEVRIDGEAASLGGPKQRALLALLLLSANTVVSRDRLIDRLWGEAAPANAQRSLDSYMSRLRALLGGDRIERHAPGYLLRLESGELDLERFETLLERGRAAAAAGDAATARALLNEGLGLWRGRALADLENEPFFAAEVGRLEERRLLAVEGRVDADLALGGGPELVTELEQLVSEHPYRERLLAQMMLALYRAGRKADALAAYQAWRRRFAEELGLEPSSELRDLERRILGQDPALGPAIPSLSIARSRRITRAGIVAAALGLTAVVASVIAGVELGMGGSSARNVGASRTGVFELAGRSIVAGASLGDAPAAMAITPTSVWAAEPNAGVVVRVDRARDAVQTIPVDGDPSTLAVGGGSVWVASVPGAVIDRISPATNRVTQRLPLGNRRVAALAFGLGRLWVADSTHQELLAYDPRTGRRLRPISIDVPPSALAVGAGYLWITDYDNGLLEEVDPRSDTGLGTIHVGDGPVAVAVGDGAVWVANELDNTVARINPVSDTLGPAIAVGTYPVALAVDGRSIAVANEYSSSVMEIDPRRDIVVRTTAVGGGPTALVSAAGRIWLGTQALGQHRGGTLTLLHTRPLSPDTALQEDVPPSQSDGLTNDALLAYARVGSGLRLVPDLAVSVPEPADGGLTYTFRLRTGIRYDDGRLVRPEDFRTAIERLFRVGAGWSTNYTSIVGAASCGVSACDLSRGIVIDDAARTITFRLTSPDPYFRQNMTSIGTAPVPPGVPFHYLGFKPMPGTGPYMIARADRHETRYVRNPYFHEWSPVAQPDGNPDVIVMKYGLSPTQEVREVETGKADWTADSVPGNLLSEVVTRFSGQWHPLANTATDFLQLNTTIPPFNDVRVRQALNYAIDRAAIVRMNGGRALATPTCQMTPPGMTGYQAYCPYTLRPSADGHWRSPDLARARRLVAASGTRGDLITVVGASDAGPLGTTVVRYTARLLRRLGYNASTEIVPHSEFRTIAWPNVQVIATDSDGSTPFFHSWFACGSRYGNGWTCDPKLDREVERAQALETTDAHAADALWEQIDHEVVDLAWAVPLDNPHFIDFFSKHIRNYEADPALGLIADQVSIR